MKIHIEHFEPICYLFEQANGRTLSDWEEQLISASGYGEAKHEQLVKVIMESIEQAPEDEGYRIAAYWSLSKRFDPELISYLKRQLKQELDDENKGTVYQLMICLDNLSEPVFDSKRTGYSLLDFELNFRDATDYLERCAQQEDARRM